MGTISRFNLTVKISVGVLFVVLCIGGGSEVRAQDADLIIINGKILTVDRNFSIAESLAVQGGKIIFVGSAQLVSRFKSAETRVIDVLGRTVIPGLIDNHFHFIRSVWNYQSEVRIDGIRSRKTVLDLIGSKSKAAPKGKWVTILGGWSPSQFADQRGEFTLEELDHAAPTTPLYIQQSYRAAYVNSKAQSLVGISEPQGAKFKG
jgi:predicted amidohydrolase YtcJ